MSDLNVVQQPTGVQSSLSVNTPPQTNLSSDNSGGISTPPTMAQPKMSIDDFANSIKQKYPTYQNQDNNDLVKAILKKYPTYADKVNVPVDQQKSSFWKPLFDPTVGFLKGIGSTIVGAGKLGEKALNLFTGGPTQGQQNAQSQIDQSLAPEGAGQKIGFYGEQAGEFLVPGSEVIKGEKIIDAASKAEKVSDLINAGEKTKNAIQAGIRIGGKATLEGVTAGGVRFIQTGGDTNESLKTGLTFGLLKGVGGALSESAKALGIPEKLYSTIFKNDYESMYNKLKTEGLQAFQKSDPELFKSLVDSGAIKTGKDGIVTVNESLAQKALDSGLKGSLTTMSNKVVKNLAMSEGKVQDIAKQVDEAAAKNATTTAVVGGPNAAKITKTLATPKNAVQLSSTEAKSYTNVLKDIAKEYKDVSFGSVSSKAANLAEKAKTGNLTAQDAVDMRRFLDKLRIQSSYNSTSSAKLSLGQMNLKSMTDVLRGKINSIPGMKEAMKEYSFNIDALEALAKSAKTQANREALSAIDNALLGGGVLMGEPVAGTAFTAARKMMQSPGIKTGVGSMIQNAGVATMPGLGAKAATSELFRNSPPSVSTQQ